MPDDTQDQSSSAPDEAQGQPGPVDSDDTTQSDAGMAGGTGTDEDEATANPVGTDPLDEDEPQRQE